MPVEKNISIVSNHLAGGGRAVERRALPPAAALASRRRWAVVTLLSSANTSPQRYLQVPSRHHGEVRVVAGP